MFLPILLSLLYYTSQISKVYAVTATAASPIRITFFVTRNPNITEEEFHHHWSTHHAPLVTPWLMKSGVLEYNQVSSPSQPDSILPIKNSPLSAC